MKPPEAKGGGPVDLTVSIISNSNRELALGSIGSVYKAADGLRLEVIVVDNLSADGSAEAIERAFPGVRLIRNERKEGFSANNNKAIRAASGDYVLLLNDDTVVHEGALSRMVGFMRENPSAGAAGAFLLNPDGTPQHTGRSRPTLLAAAMISLGIHRLFPDNPVTSRYFMKDWPSSGPVEVESINGAAMMLSMKAVDRVGLLDEGFFIFCEDVDYSIRLAQAGYRLYVLPDARVTHYRGASTVGRRMVWIYHKSLLRFYRKHYAPGRFFLVNWAVYTAIFLRLVAYMLYGSVRRRG